MRVHSYQKLTVWQKSVDLVIEIYRITSRFPGEEKFGISIQLKRAAVSISSNIAEGSRRGGAKEFKHFLRIALGSASEIETQLIIAKRLKFGILTEYPSVEGLLSEVFRMLNKLIEAL